MFYKYHENLKYKKTILIFYIVETFRDKIYVFLFKLKILNFFFELNKIDNTNVILLYCVVLLYIFFAYRNNDNFIKKWHL